MNVLIDRCLGRARLAAELVEQWQVDHRHAMMACDVDELLAECTEGAELLKRAWQSSVDRLFDEKIDNVDVVGKYLALTVAKILSIYGKVDEAVDLALRTTGHSLDNLDAFRAAQQVVRQLAEDIRTTWPKVDEQMILESKASYSREDYLSAEDWLRDAQGIGSQEN